MGQVFKNELSSTNFTLSILEYFVPNGLDVTD